MSITKYFSILVASGNGQRCNELREIIRNEFYHADLRHNQNDEKGKKKKISRHLAKQITPLFKDVSDYYFSIDLSKPTKSRNP